jgi:hypothetical protein
MLGRTISSLPASLLLGRADISYAFLLPALLLGCVFHAYRYKRTSHMS